MNKEKFLPITEGFFNLQMDSLQGSFEEVFPLYF